MAKVKEPMNMKVKQIKIEFNVTPEIKRFVYAYLIATVNGCALIDSGVAGSEKIIEEAIIETGHDPAELLAVFLTHAHPDHIGTAHYFREKYGAKIYAGEGERAWIEDINLQFAQRPIPNFYNLAGSSTPVDNVVKNGDSIQLADDIHIEVIGTPGHSADEVSYRIGNMAFIGDALPVKGDIPIFVDIDNTRRSITTLEDMSGVEVFYPAWDRDYSPEDLRCKAAEARELIDDLQKTAHDIGRGLEGAALAEQVCERLGKPMWKSNPLFARTIACCRKGGHYADSDCKKRYYKDER